MEKIQLVKSNGEIINIFVARKVIKNVHLKVYSDLKVSVSIPENVPTDWVNQFIKKRERWIIKQIDKYKQAEGHNNLGNLKNGSSIQMLGKDIVVRVIEADKNYVEKIEKKIFVYVKSIKDEKLINDTFEKWWKIQCKSIFLTKLDTMYENIIRKHGVEKPTIHLKKMKTLWGSCTKRLSKITLNEYLLKANLMCIEYVILHELAHLIHQNHSRDFYNFLTIYMPDWKERKKQLDHEVVQGLE